MDGPLFVEAEAAKEEDDEPFEEKIVRLSKTLEEQFAEAGVLQASIVHHAKEFVA